MSAIDSKPCPQQEFNPFWLFQWDSWGLDTMEMQLLIFAYFSCMSSFPNRYPHFSKSLLLQVRLFLPPCAKSCLWVFRGCNGPFSHCEFLALTQRSLPHWPHTQLLPCALLSSNLLPRKISCNSWN